MSAGSRGGAGPDAESDPALIWAQRVTAEDVSFAELDQLLLADHPALARRAAQEDAWVRARPRGGGAPGVVVAVAGALALVAPVLGVAVYGEHPELPSLPRTDPSTYLAMSPAAFTVTGVILLIWLLGRLLRGDGRSPVQAAYGVFAAVCALFGVVGLPARAAEDEVFMAGWRLWPGYAVVGLGAAATLVGLLRIRGGGPDTDTVPDPAGGGYAPEDGAELSVLARARVTARRDAALAVLTRRGVVAEGIVDQAGRVPVGQLARLDRAHGLPPGARAPH